MQGHRQNTTAKSTAHTRWCVARRKPELLAARPHCSKLVVHACPITATNQISSFSLWRHGWGKLSAISSSSCSLPSIRGGCIEQHYSIRSPSSSIRCVILLFVFFASCSEGESVLQDVQGGLQGGLHAPAEVLVEHLQSGHLVRTHRVVRSVCTHQYFFIFHSRSSRPQPVRSPGRQGQHWKLAVRIPFFLFLCE